MKSIMDTVGIVAGMAQFQNKKDQLNLDLHKIHQEQMDIVFKMALRAKRRSTLALGIAIASFILSLYAFIHSL